MSSNDHIGGNRHVLKPTTLLTNIHVSQEINPCDGRGGGLRRGLKPSSIKIPLVNVVFKTSSSRAPKSRPPSSPTSTSTQTPSNTPKPSIKKPSSPKPENMGANRYIDTNVPPRHKLPVSPRQMTFQRKPEVCPKETQVCPKEAQVSHIKPQPQTPLSILPKPVLSPRIKEDESRKRTIGPRAFSLSSASSSGLFHMVSPVEADTKVNNMLHPKEEPTLATESCDIMDFSVQRKLGVCGRKAGKNSRVVPDVSTHTLSLVMVEPPRCKFITPQTDPVYVKYHDEEWGVPVHDDRRLFELLVLAGARVELNWTMILHKRDAYREAFCGYDPLKLASFTEKDIQMLEANQSLLLLSGKIRGIVDNARQILQIVKEFGSFDKYLWAFFGNKPIVKIYRDTPQVPSKTPKSEYVSKDLVKRGFRFVGPSIVYSFMQASGMTNDHLVQCFRQQACKSFYQNSGPQLT